MVFCYISCFWLVSASPVAWTKKKTETRPDATECNQTAGCGCPDFGFFRLPVSQFGKYNKTAGNQLTPVATGLFLYKRMQIKYIKYYLHKSTDISKIRNFP